MTQIKFEEKTYNTDSLDLHLWKRIFTLFKAQKKDLIKLLVINIFIAIFDASLPFLNKLAIDVFASGKGTKLQFSIFIAVFVVGVLIQAFSVYFFIKIAGKVEMDMSYDLRSLLFEKLQTLSYSFFDKTPAGWLLARMTSDIARLTEILAWYLMDFAWGVAVMIFATIVMFKTNIILAILVLLFTPLLAMIAKYFNIRILKNYRDVRKINSRITNAFNEGIGGAQTTKTLVLEDIHYQDFLQETFLMKKTSIHASFLSSIFTPLVIFVSSFAIAIILVYGGKQVFLQTIQFGTLVMFVQYANQFFEPLNQISSIIAELQMAQASGERVLSLLDEKPKIVDTPDVVQTYGTSLNPKYENYQRIHGDIVFEHVNFHYLPEEPVLKDFNLTVKAGETVALVGETGSGKSTIINLLCRFYEPVSGNIYIDGVEYRQRSIHWLHNQIGYVLQTPHLFSGSIIDNLRFAKEDATEEEIRQACRLVNAESMIEKLEQGYHTEVGEGGDRLSTGQKQLISFARAIIRDPSILILDEATSSVDTQTEQVIQDTIDNVMKGRTTFIVAHRLSTIVNADKILVIQKGEVVESGNHASLMEKKGYYYQLYTNQFTKQQEDVLMKHRSGE